MRLLLLACIVTLFSVDSSFAFPSPERTQEAHAQDSTADATDAYNKGVQRQEKAFALFAKDDSTKAVKELSKAVKEYEKAIALNDSFPEALSNLGYCRRNLGDYTKALEAYDLALKLKPHYPAAIEYRAVAYLWLGRTDEAKSEYERLLKMDSTQAVELMNVIQAAEAGKLKSGRW